MNLDEIWAERPIEQNSKVALFQRESLSEEATAANYILGYIVTCKLHNTRSQLTLDINEAFACMKDIQKYCPDCAAGKPALPPRKPSDLFLSLDAAMFQARKCSEAQRREQHLEDLLSDIDL